MSKNILALVDFSNSTDDVIEKAAELTSMYKGKCWLLHVAAPEPDFVGYEVGPQYIRDSRAGVLRDEHLKIQGYQARLEDRGIECEALLVQGQLFRTIMGEIEKLKIDTVVLGSHGRGMLYEILVGSVCEHLLKHSKVPLLIIPSRDLED